MALGYYQTYTTVVFGLVVAIGLQQFATQVLSDELISLAQLLLLLGTFITSIHFWMVCVSSDTFSDAAYEVLEGGNRPGLFNLLFIFDILFATAFAGCALVMFQSVQSNNEMFFLFFGMLAALSLTYDVCAIVFASFAASKSATKDARNKVRVYIRTYGTWLWQDLLYVAAAWTLFYLAVRHFMSLQVLFASVFLAITIIAVILDVILLQPSLYKRI